MQKYIENLRNKPEHHRKRVTLGVSTLVTAVVFVVWLSVLLPHGSNQVVARNEPEAPQVGTPVATLKTGVAQVFTAIKSLFSGTEGLNFQGEYENIKNQVETGQIRLTPVEPEE
jgi:hypothetical protein